MRNKGKAIMFAAIKASTMAFFVCSFLYMSLKVNESFTNDKTNLLIWLDIGKQVNSISV
jgi:hypothetical protein